MRKANGSRALNAQLATVNSRLERLSITDELTGLFNRRHAILRLDEQWSIAERYGKPLTIAMIDIDHFKKINDEFGHDTGDTILRQVAKILREQTRVNDPVCRIGGEEFLIILGMQTGAEARICAERCRAAVEGHEFDAGGKKLKITISAGIASRLPGMGQVSDLLKAGDLQLYAAKHAGRNLVKIAAEAEAAASLSTASSQVAAAQSSPPAVSSPAAAVPTQTPVPTSAPAPSPAPVSSPAAVSSPIDFQAILKRCGGDAKFAAALVKRFRSQAVNDVKRMEQLLLSGDANGLALAAHSMKSMTAYVSADTASNIAKQIEMLARNGQFSETGSLINRLSEAIVAAESWFDQNPIAA
jgi:diguanylate cyclase (GGDEF)-like protein